MKQFIQFISLFTFILVLASCTKDEFEADITFNEPLNAATYTSGDTVNVNIDFASDDIIEKVSVKLIDTSDNSEQVLADETVDAKSHTINTGVIITVAAATNIKIVAEAKGEDGDIISGERSIEVNP